MTEIIKKLNTQLLFYTSVIGKEEVAKELQNIIDTLDYHKSLIGVTVTECMSNKEKIKVYIPVGSLPGDVNRPIYFNFVDEKYLKLLPKYAVELIGNHFVLTEGEYFKLEYNFIKNTIKDYFLLLVNEKNINHKEYEFNYDENGEKQFTISLLNILTSNDSILLKYYKEREKASEITRTLCSVLEIEPFNAFLQDSEYLGGLIKTNNVRKQSSKIE